MKKNETEQIIDFMLTKAKENYESDQFFNDFLAETKKRLEDDPDLFYAELQADYKKSLELLDDPGYMQDKNLALIVCNALIQLCLGSGGMKDGSIIHLLGLRLYDYINRIV
ncbi:MAG: hypothetical protein LBH07_01195 [Treponema sp.]|jgi:hypothetical protein|nr:hypothetical protein [Treponema sp.]